MGSKKQKLKLIHQNNNSKIKQPSNIGTADIFNNPIFCFKYLSKKYCISECDKEQKSALLDKLFKWGQTTWNEILSSGRQGMGHEKIALNSLKATPPEIVKNDYVLSTYFLGKNCRLIGHKNGSVFHVLWIDKALELYKH